MSPCIRLHGKLKEAATEYKSHVHYGGHIYFFSLISTYDIYVVTNSAVCHDKLVLNQLLAQAHPMVTNCSFTSAVTKLLLWFYCS